MDLATGLYSWPTNEDGCWSWPNRSTCILHTLTVVRWASCGHSVKRISGREWSAATLPVSLPKESFDRNCVVTCLVWHTDRRQVTLLCLLDLSSAFNCVDHDLLQRLRLGFGLTDAVLEWIRTVLVRSHAADSVQRPTCGNTTTAVRRSTKFRVGAVTIRSVHGWARSLAYQHGMGFHQYGDDSQVYISVPVSDAATAVQRITVFIEETNSWLSASRLRLNPAKTEVMCLDPDNKSTRSTLVIFWSCRQASRSLSRRGTLASLSTVSCRCRHTLLRFAGPDFITWGSYVHSVGHYQQKLQWH